MAEGLYIYHEGHEQEHQQVMRELKEAADAIVNINGRIKSLYDGLRGASFAGQAQGLREWSSLTREATKGMNDLTDALKRNTEAQLQLSSSQANGAKNTVDLAKGFNSAWKAGKELVSTVKALGNSFKTLGGIFTLAATFILVVVERLAASSRAAKDAILANVGLKNSIERLIDGYKELNGEVGRTERLAIAKARAFGKTQEEVNKIQRDAIQERIRLKREEIRELQKEEVAAETNVAIKNAGGIYTDKDLEEATTHLEKIQKALSQAYIEGRELNTDLEVKDYEIQELARIKKERADEELRQSKAEVARLAKERNEANSQKRLAKEAELRDAEQNARQREAAANAQMRKMELDEELRNHEEIFKDEQKSLEERLTAYGEYIKAKQEMLWASQEAEQSAIQEKLDKIDAIEQDKNRKLSDDDKKLLAEKDALLAERYAITAKYIYAENDLAAESKKFIADATKDSQNDTLRNAEAAFQKSHNLAEANYNEKKALLHSQYAQGKIDHKKYTQEMEELEREWLLESYNRQLEYVKQVIALKKAMGEDTSALEAAVASFKLKIEELASDKTLKDLEEFKAKLKEVINQLPKYLKDAAAAYYDNRISFHQDEIKRIEDEKEARILALKQEGLTAKELAAEKEIVENSAAALRRKHEQEIRRETVRKAKFERAAGIAQTIINTTAAVTDVLPNIPLAVLIGALGAIQIGIASAQPIPQYFRGTEHAPEGWATVGEKGTEAVITPDGKLSFTPNKTTLTYLEEGTKVIPHEETKALVAMSSSLGMSSANMAMLLRREKGVDTTPAIKEQTNALLSKLDYQTGYLKDLVRKPVFKVIGAEYERYRSNKL